MEPKNSFLLYTEQKEIIDELSNEDAGELIKAIYAYAAGKEVNLRKDLYLVFIPIRQQIDRNNAKYDDFKKKQSENGKKGGRPTTNNENPKNPTLFSENPKNPTLFSENPKNPTLFSKTQKSLNVNVNDNVNVNVNDNVNVNVNDNDNDNVLLFSKENNKRVDFLCGDEVEKIFKIYKEKCPDLQSMTFERRNKDMRKLIADYLQETAFDYGYFEKICAKGNELREIAGNKIDLKMLIRNHIGINNGKYDNKASPDNKRGLSEEDINDLFD